MNTSSTEIKRAFACCTVAILFAGMGAIGAWAQNADVPKIAAVTLPEAPSALAMNEAPTFSDSTGAASAAEPAMLLQAPPTSGGAVAPKYAAVIASNETAQNIDAHDKVIIGLRNTYALTSLGGIVLSAGYDQLTNGQPNYGTNRTAFGQRVGAAAVRSTSDAIFVDSVFAPLLHEDPRYYAQGDRRSFGGRVVYAVTRVLVTRTDSGHATVNAALLAGYAATAAMTPLYYPQINRNFKDVASGYGGSLGGAAIGNLASEFANPILQKLHLEKRD